MKNKDLKKQLKNLQKTPVNESSFVVIKESLKKYMDFYSVKREAQTTSQKIKTGKSYSPLLKFATVMVIFGLILGGGRAVYASRSSLPGEALYPIKLITEDLQKIVIFDQSKKAEFEIHLAEKRVEEIKSLEEKESVDREQIEKTKGRLNIHLDKATKLSTKESNDFKKTIEKNIQTIEKKIGEPRNENASNINIKLNNEIEKIQENNYEDNNNFPEIKKIPEKEADPQGDDKISTENSKEDIGKRPEKSDNKGKDR
jgi:hypothetical protein